MGERRIEAALRQATDTQNVNIAAGASVPDVFLEGFSECSAVAIAALYELILERDLGAALDIESLCDSWPTREAMERSVLAQHTSQDLRSGAVEQTLAKYISAGELAQRLELLRDVWTGLREKVRVQLMPAEQIRETLRAAGCPTGPVEIGLRWEDFEATYSRARTIRKRYTVLDLAFEAGILEECVDELFAPGGFWGRTAAQTRADVTRVAGGFRRSDEA
jgi:glycerol-1-phosphate dehydrogenase [NAD(P)+]